MFLTMMKSKIHRATVTHSNLNYEGSLGIDGALMYAAGITNFEQIHVLNINTGDRFVTYAIQEDYNKGMISLNGAGARLGQPGDLLIIITYCQMKDDKASIFIPKVVLVDKNNKIKVSKK